MLDLHKFVRIGWTCIKLLLITCSNFILTTSEICQTERAIETKQALSHTMRAFSTGCSYLTSYAANFPFSGTGGSQKVTMDTHGISKAPIENSSDNLRCFLFVWIRQLPVRSCKTTSGALKLDVAPSIPRGKKNIFWVPVSVALIRFRYGFPKTVFFYYSKIWV